MAQYRQVKRNGRWVTINTKTGKEVGVGEGTLGDIAKRVGNELSYAGKNLVYSDKTDDKGRPLTIAQANQTSKPKPQVPVKPPVKPKPKPKPIGYKEGEVVEKEGNKFVFKGGKFIKVAKPAEVQPAKPPVRAPQQPTTVQKPAAKPAAKPAEKPKPMTQMGDVRGSKFEGGPSANEKMTIGKKVEGMEATPGVKADGTDMERRRAFLDADNSLKGMKAVRELLEKRKKEQKIKRQ